MNFEHFKYNKASLPKDAGERLKYLKQLKEEFIEEIKNSETAKEYFANYRPDSIEYFIKAYTDEKVHLLECYEFYSNKYHEKEISELHYYKQAEEMLQLILQKKLFNMQLRWRAGQLEIDEINIAYDFHFWGKHIYACSFIPTITHGELELMKEYLLRFDEGDEDGEGFIDWQDYDSITKKMNMAIWIICPTGTISTTQGWEPVCFCSCPTSKEQQRNFIWTFRASLLKRPILR